MARMHSPSKGRAGSKKLARDKAPAWIRYKPKEIEMLIIKLAKEGKSSSMIGLILRDHYGIPSVKQAIGKKIYEVLKEKKLTGKLPEDLTNLIRRALKLRKHFEENKQDKTAKRGIELTEGKIRRLVKYYKNKGVIDKSWNYNPKNAGLFLE